MGLFARLADMLGRGESDTLSIPPLDGPFKPNNLLDLAERVLNLPDVDNLAVAGGRLVCSSGDTLFSIDPPTRQASPLRRFDGKITAVASSSSGVLAVGIEGFGIEFGAGGEWRRRDLGDANGSVTALFFRSEDELITAIGSHRHNLSDWKRDLMSHGASGAVLSINPDSGSRPVVLGEKLAFPYGLAVGLDGSIVVAESWKHRLVTLASEIGASPRIALDQLPAYAARLSPAQDGGYWLALFAPRRQLTELVLREDDYRQEMMSTIPIESWIGPDFSDHANGDQPLQSGSVRQMGIMKPWAPSRSYGLVARLDSSLQPVASYHSRADGMMHGIASVIELDGQVYVASRGAGVLLRFPVGTAG